MNEFSNLEQPGILKDYYDSDLKRQAQSEYLKRKKKKMSNNNKLKIDPFAEVDQNDEEGEV